MQSTSPLAERLEVIRCRLEAACERANRNPAEVTLMAVSKSHPPEAVATAASLGIRVFGENKVQEARTKIPLCPAHLEWHMIGHLQSNKCRDAVQLFRMVQGIDSLRLATELDKAAAKASRTLPILLEVNVAGEASKFGYHPDQVLRDLTELNRLPRLELHGLMAIPPYTPDPSRTRVWFQSLRELRERCQQALGAPLPHLSMGMSHDFESAVEEGSTLIRIGTALFGERSYRSRPDPDAASPAAD